VFKVEPLANEIMLQEFNQQTIQPEPLSGTTAGTLAKQLSVGFAKIGYHEWGDEYKMVTKSSLITLCKKVAKVHLNAV
jgi:hypothetical protein